MSCDECERLRKEVDYLKTGNRDLRIELSRKHFDCSELLNRSVQRRKRITLLEELVREMMAILATGKSQILNVSYMFDLPKRFRESFNDFQTKSTDCITKATKVMEAK